jgi:4-aminobutyrate aminotransferase/(S)-3-amino-2-methylpropionate transaminase
MTETTAKIVTAIPGPKSLELLARRNAAVPRGVSHNTDIFAETAKGALIRDVDGNVFIDFAAGIGVINVGHCADEVVAAIKEQTERYIHTSINVAPYEPYVALAERLNAAAPIDNAKTMFVNSGAEAVENAVKIAKKFTGRTGIVTVDGSFHGRTLLTMSLTTKVKPYKDGFGPFAPDTYKIPCPNVYRNATDLSSDEFALSCAEEFAQMLQISLSPEMVACVIIEPVQGEGGFIPMPVAYLKRMREICSENGIVLIIDEIQSGMARTGTLFAIEQAGIAPDLLTTSKSLAAGLPLSAVIGRADIMDAAQAGGIGGTFAGNPVACAAALAVLDNIEKYDLNAKARKLGEYLTGRLNEMKAKYPVVGDVRGLGAMIGMEFVRDRKTKEPNKEIIGKITANALRHGVIFINAGILSNVIRFLPPLVMTEEQAEYSMDVLDAAIAESL